MAFKSHIENSLASLREATLVATKQSKKTINGLLRRLTPPRNDSTMGAYLALIQVN
ncbi:hypothetical protein RiCNE_10570 [Rickettsia endosymbiont of Culicoides newsteadi]|nr:hypothetical protein RiCNE_10570 [Rickettsia endosymbiont of Culicoides newsteadi]